MSGTEICDVFDTAFGEITQKLVRIELRKTSEDAEKKNLGTYEEGYWELIQTKGYINVKVICHFSEELFHYITDTMNGGDTPTDEEVSLYLNEYVNIICGHALSKLNDMAKRPSRLSVPSFYRKEEPMDVILDNAPLKFLSYHSRAGNLQVFICFSVENSQKEEKA